MVAKVARSRPPPVRAVVAGEAQLLVEVTPVLGSQQREPDVSLAGAVEQGLHHQTTVAAAAVPGQRVDVEDVPLETDARSSAAHHSLVDDHAAGGDGFAVDLHEPGEKAFER